MARYALIHTLGCRLNQADSAMLIDRLQHAGYTILETEGDLPAGEKLSLALINSCTVTATASQKSRQAARKLRRDNPDAMIVVTGCSAEIDFADWQNERAVDLILTNPEKRRIAEILLDNKKSPQSICGEGQAFSCHEAEKIFQEHAEGRFPFRSRAFLKIQEGCNNFCTYCIVPYARGPERSRSSAEIIAECKRLGVSGNFPEIVLTGVNVCAYNDHGKTLEMLLDELCLLPGNWRIRLSSTEPYIDNLSLLDTMARHKRICRFLHLSLQYGDDTILKAMNRHYNCAEYRDFAKIAREKIPGIHLGTDIIVGFPGETDETFGNCCALVEEIGFANIHIFTYSPRKGTPAAAMPSQIPPALVRRRYNHLHAIAEKQKQQFAESQTGKILPVIFEEIHDGIGSGWSDNYLRVFAPIDQSALHAIQQVQIERIGNDSQLFGTII